jgi:hypothetical protein
MSAIAQSEYCNRLSTTRKGILIRSPENDSAGVAVGKGNRFARSVRGELKLVALQGEFSLACFTGIRIDLPLLFDYTGVMSGLRSGKETIMNVLMWLRLKHHFFREKLTDRYTRNKQKSWGTIRR